MEQDSDALCQWGEKPILQKGIITGCTRNQEWMLPWWWMHLRMHNEYPVTFFDLGDMSPTAKNWCSKKGRLESLRHSIDSFIAPREAVAPDLVKLWESHKNLNIWKARLAYFRKPFACLQSPYERTLWIDLDCQVRRSLDPIFAFCDSPSGVAAGEENPFISEIHRSWGALLERELDYNTGVIAFKHGASVIQKWASYCLTRNRDLRGDQDAFDRLLHEQKITISTFPSNYNESVFVLKSLKIEPRIGSQIIFHWLGNGKQFIRAEIANFENKAFMNFLLE